MNNLEKIYKVGVIGATGMVGQRFVTLLENHPNFKLTLVAASGNSAGETYEKAVENRWKMTTPIPQNAKNLIIYDAFASAKKIAEEVDFVFCAVNLPKKQIQILEEMYAKLECPVISNNSACRNLADIPMILPECNSEHLEIISAQKKRLGTKRGFILAKPNCSLQSYVPALEPLRKFGLERVLVVTCQAISGAGKTFETFPEIVDNVIPFISGEEEKTSKEPLKIWGKIAAGEIIPAKKPAISAQCIRVPVSDGHLATVFVDFEKKASKDEIIEAWENFAGLNLPSAPKKPLRYLYDENRPQTRLDRMWENGMGISIGRLQEDSQYQWRFVCLSHNTLRGAAGGAILCAELCASKGILISKF